MNISTAAVVVATLTAGCSASLDTSLDRLTEARTRSTQLLSQFTKSVDAGHRAVMSVDERESRAAADEAREAMRAAAAEVTALGPIVDALRYSAERRQLGEFEACFAAYRPVTENILELAVEGSNVKAQRLSFGRAREAATAFKEALGALSSVEPDARWHADALAATALAAVYEIQALQGPHIAEPDDAAMTVLEQQMAAAERIARTSTDNLAGLVPASGRPRISAAVAALDRFMAVNAEIVVLSRRNSNVRSLALSLGQRRLLAARCEDALNALQGALAARRFGGSR